MTKFYLLILIFLSINNIHSFKFLHIDINNIKLKSILKKLFPENEPGAAVLITRNDTIIFEEYFGLSSLPKGPKITKETAFNIASVSKQFTAIAVLQLVEKGKISLDEPLFIYFLEYKVPLWKKRRQNIF